MLMTSTTSRLLSILFFATALGATACKTAVIGGNDGEGGGGGGAGGAGGSGGQGGSIVVGPPSAIAEYGSSVQDPPSDTGSTTGGGTTPEDPSTLHVRIGNYGPTCGGSAISPFTCTTTTVWQLSLTLPPELQAAGTVVQLGDEPFIGMFSETGSNGSPDDCWGGGGTFSFGTLEVLSNDGATIVLRIAGSNAGFSDVPVDGDYTAPICH
ncbi:Hypothetical protein A7982_04793 [Minicystis rosea]|nr:Hypothetical protein A7982_04793 [Minicystis rosea]